jgi:hypothetical protein
MRKNLYCKLGNVIILNANLLFLLNPLWEIVSQKFGRQRLKAVFIFT